MSDYEDRNIIGRLGAAVVIALALFGAHRLNCGEGMCALMKTDSCCAGEKR